MGNTAYTKIITLLLTTLMVCGGYSYEAKAQEFNSDEAHSYATYVVVRQKRDKFQAGDTIRWRHNLRLNIGVPSLMQTHFLDRGLTTNNSSQSSSQRLPTASEKLAKYRYYTTPTYMIPPIAFEYSYYVNKWLEVGGKATFTALYNEVRNIDTEERLYSNGSYGVSLILNVRFDYLRREHIQLYSAVGAGLAARFAYNRGILTPMYDFTCFGISVGKSFYGFAEIGGGLSGSVRAGIGYRF